MASDASVPNNFTAGTPAVADDVDANFAAVVNWINANAVHLDASKAFANVPSGPATDPTSDNQLTRKAYVDAKPDLRVGARLALSSAQTFNSGAGVENFSWTSEVEDTHGFITVPSTTVTIPAGYAGVYVISAVVFNVATMTINNFTTAIIDVNGTGIPLGTVQAQNTTCGASFVTPLTVGATVKLSIDTSVTGTANAYLNLYRISA